MFPFICNITVFDPSAPAKNQSVTITSLIKNNGNTNLSLDSVNISFYVKDVLYDSENINLTNISEMYVNFTWLADYGARNISIKADPENLINESNETSNEINKIMYVNATDLKPITITYTELIDNKTITFIATMTNLGSKDTNNTKFSMIIDNTTINSTIVNISANSQANVTFNWTAVRGIHNLTIAADPENVINESYESNNNLTIQVFVVDAFVSDDAFLTAPSEVNLGEEFNISLFLKNTGTLDLENVIVSLILSAEFNTTNSTEINVGNLSVSDERVFNWKLKGAQPGQGDITLSIRYNGSGIDEISREIPVCSKGDFNCNQNIEIEDFVKLCITYTGISPHNLYVNSKADFDSDHDVDLIDFIKFLAEYKGTK